MNTHETSLLIQANNAFQEGKFHDAIALYQKSFEKFPQLKDIYSFNLALAKSRINGQRISIASIESEKRAAFTKKNVVIFWKQNDTGLYGRRHEMMAKSIDKLDQVDNVIIIDAPVSETLLLRKCQDSTLTHHQAVYSAAAKKFVGNFRASNIPIHVFLSEEMQFENYKKYLSNLFSQYRIDPYDSVFWFYPKVPFDVEIINEFQPKKVVVDIVDDHRAWPGLSESEKEKLTIQYKSILSRADIAIANCKSTIESLSVFHSDIRLVPNGCEVDLEANELYENACYQRIKAFKGRVIGYVGNLESKIDFLLIEKLANTFCNDLMVLIGSTHANPSIRKLQDFPNILMVGPIKYENVNAFIRLFSVAIVPHIKNSLTNNMNPLKIYVYASNRIPVVCTSVKNVPIAEFIRVANSHQEFIDICDSLLSGEEAFSRDCFENFIQQNSWDSRIASVVRNLVELTNV